MYNYSRPYTLYLYNKWNAIYEQCLIYPVLMFVQVSYFILFMVEN